jgi:type IV pilus assembly protein PilV
VVNDVGFTKNHARQSRSRRLQRGASLIEVLVTVAVMAVGLVGLTGLQARLQVAEFDSYQRSQALLLANDLASRIALNRNLAADYLRSGTNAIVAGSCPATGSTRTAVDLSEWCSLLEGAAEVRGTSKVGAVIGGRGCVESTDDGYMVTVAWQGMVPLSAPPEGVACGAGSYDSAGAGCTNDRCRRVVTTLVRVAALL